ncbi:uncharacterized protein PV06_06972 [Exophiala oligosperma]|uniref:Uncharacterized protein n=1 Tax=Exophiala oligosperma TaxID=215243 RepID=A0A0D2DG69_9EURO|nr:uncharacterized protein PV06_06972 [Exophiala oligosperma]KIW41410.1 hypothetical protein PV06_06972 [Exophiala oligosperma]
MEEFSQSRGDDDLFDDEIVPFENDPTPEQVAVQLDQVSLDPTPTPPPPPPAVDQKSTSAPSTAPAAAPAPAPGNNNFPGFRDSKPRGRGGRGAAPRGGGQQSRGGLSDSKWAPKPAKQADTSTTRRRDPETTPEVQTETTTTLTTSAPASGSGTEAHEPEPPAQTEGGDESAPTTAAPNAPSAPANARPPAVRGDRSATGGTRKPKLTEEELSAKLAAAKERSQNLAAAHARAQADAANFEERERIAQQKREKDRIERKVMDNEREKNRQRKMAVMGGREWDAGKNEDDFNNKFNGRGGAAGRRGYQGTMTPEQQYQAEQDDLRQYEWHGDRARGGGGRGRARGGRGAGGGRGRGGGARGGWGGGENGAAPPPDLAADADFPALPTTTVAPDSENKTSDGTPMTKPKMSRWDSGTLSPSGDGGGGGSWAEQVESSEADKIENTVKT